jgi:hypothetical protein
MRGAEQGTRVIFLTSLVGGFENGSWDDFVVVVGVGCEVRVGCGGCGCDGVESC